MSSAKKGLVAGALSLAVTGLIAKILGVIYMVPFQNMAGDDTLGLYQYAYSIYVVMLTVATAGIPLAMSKLISERLTRRDYAGADRVYRVGARYLSLAGVAIFLVTFVLGGWIAIWMGDYRAHLSIRALSFALLIVPLLAAMRGYVQGHQLMAVSGNSQVVEQFVRSFAILFGVWLATSMKASHNMTAAVATFSAVLGAVASVFFIGRHVVKIRREDRKRFLRESTEPNRDVLRTILKIAIPISLSSLVLPLSQAVDSFSITKLLIYGFDFTREQATSEYGVLTGRALRLIALPLALATGVGLSLMPAISEAIAERNVKLTNERVISALRLTSFFAFPTSIGIYVLAGPIDIALFENLKGADTIAMVSFMAIFSSYELVTTYILQAMGLMYLPVKNMFIGLGLKLLLNIFLVPQFGIFGAAISSVLGYLLSSLLNFGGVKRHGNTPLSINNMFGKPLLASLIMGVVVWMITWIPFDVVLPWERISNLLKVLVGGGVGAVVFFVLMVLMKGLSREEMKRLPLVKRLVR
jgi:polysaccharide transporter, PST family